MLATLAIERFGGRIGGLLATVPTTIIPACLGIWNESADHHDFVWAMAVVPMGMWVNSFFLWLWRVVPPRLPSTQLGPRLASMLLVGLTGWSLAAIPGLYLCKRLRLSGVEPLILGGFVTCVMTVMGIAACRHHVPSPPGTQRVSLIVLASRGVLAGLCIVFSVWLTAAGMPLVSGIASVFPAIFLTTMVSIWLAQGEAVQSGAVGPMMLGSTSVSVFALIAASVLHLIPVWLGLVVSWVGSVVLVSIPAYLWLQRRQMERHPRA